MQSVTWKSCHSPGECANTIHWYPARSSMGSPPYTGYSIFLEGGYCSMKIRPLYDRIVVKRIETQEQMHGGLYIPDTAKEKPQEGEVLAVGKGKRMEDGKVIPLDVQVGDKILFGKYSGSDIKLDADE